MSQENQTSGSQQGQRPQVKPSLRASAPHPDLHSEPHLRIRGLGWDRGCAGLGGGEGLCVTAAARLRTSQAPHNRKSRTPSMSSKNIKGPTHRAQIRRSEKGAHFLLKVGPSSGVQRDPPPPALSRRCTSPCPAPCPATAEEPERKAKGPRHLHPGSAAQGTGLERIPCKRGKALAVRRCSS